MNDEKTAVIRYRAQGPYFRPDPPFDGWAALALLLLAGVVLLVIAGLAP